MVEERWKYDREMCELEMIREFLLHEIAIIKEILRPDPPVSLEEKQKVHEQKLKEINETLDNLKGTKSVRPKLTNEERERVAKAVKRSLALWGLC